MRRAIILGLLVSPWLTPQQPPLASLAIYVSSDGKPAAARVYIRDGNGRTYLIPNAVTYSRRGEEHSVIDQSAVVNLAPGTYRVRAEKGAEYRSVERTVSVAAGEPARVDLDVQRFYDMN